MITFIAHLKVRPENLVAMEALLASVREQSRTEPGVLYYDFARAVDATDMLVVIEVYRDATAQAEHMATRWVQDSLPRSMALVEGGFDIRQYVSPGTAPVKRRIGDV